jgi:hypothetical protein
MPERVLNRPQQSRLEVALGWLNFFRKFLIQNSFHCFALSVRYLLISHIWTVHGLVQSVIGNWQSVLNRASSAREWAISALLINGLDVCTTYQDVMTLMAYDDSTYRQGGVERKFVSWHHTILWKDVLVQRILTGRLQKVVPQYVGFV